jgi:hypothetical protein
MRQYAEHLDGYHLIILTRKQRWVYIEEVHEGSLHLYPTTVLIHDRDALYRILLIARKIIGRKKAPWVVTAQDPLEIGWLSFLIAKVMKVRLHVQVHGDYFQFSSMGRALVISARAEIFCPHAPPASTSNSCRIKTNHGVTYCTGNSSRTYYRTPDTSRARIFS